MPITATTGESREKEMVTEGSHEVMLVRVVDLGTQPGRGKYPEPKRSLKFIYEVMDQKMMYNGKEQPMWLYDDIAPVHISLSKETNYHKLLNKLFGKVLSYEEAQRVEFEDILGNIYLAQVTHNGKWENVSSITKASKKMAEQYKDYVASNDKFVFSLENFDENVFNKLGQKTQEKIKSSPEYNRLLEGDTEIDPNEEMLPF